MIRFFIRYGLALFALGCIVMHCIGCGLLTSREAKEATAEASYLGQQLKCVDDEPPLPFDATIGERGAANLRVNRCRELVRERWGVVETARDGGVK